MSNHIPMAAIVPDYVAPEADQVDPGTPPPPVAPSTAGAFRRVQPGHYESNGWTIRRTTLSPMHGRKETAWNVYPSRRTHPAGGVSRMAGYRQVDTLAEAKAYARHTAVPPEGQTAAYAPFTTPATMDLDQVIAGLEAMRDGYDGGPIAVYFGDGRVGTVRAVMLASGAIQLAVMKDAGE